MLATLLYTLKNYGGERVASLMSSLDSVELWF